MTTWKYKDDGETFGPYTAEEAIALYGNGKITEETLIQKEGQEEWIPYAESELASEAAATAEEAQTGFSDQVKDVFFTATEKINEMAGEKGNIDLKLSDVFSNVTKKHTKEESELLFISGTSATTPEEHEISSSWPKPWLFSRVFLILALTFFFLYLATFLFQNLNALPGLIFIGSFAVPFSLLIFFWETNAPRNISIFEVVKMFFVGGVASIVAALVIFSIFPVYELNIGGAIMVGITEEIGKLVIVAYFIKQLKVKFILNGLLIGAAVGSGFAAFESAGYAFNMGMQFGNEAMFTNIMDRAWTSLGSHVAWAAITGAALTLVKGSAPLSKNHLLDKRFLKLFAAPVIMHTLWNSPLPLLHHFYILHIILIAVAWIFIFTLMNAGLKQISRLNTEDGTSSESQ